MKYTYPWQLFEQIFNFHLVAFLVGFNFTILITINSLIPELGIITQSFKLQKKKIIIFQNALLYWSLIWNITFGSRHSSMVFLHLRSCIPRFESQAHHLHYFQFILLKFNLYLFLEREKTTATTRVIPRSLAFGRWQKPFCRLCKYSLSYEFIWCKFLPAKKV